jgi:hypothetical protein
MLYKNKVFQSFDLSELVDNKCRKRTTKKIVLPGGYSGQNDLSSAYGDQIQYLSENIEYHPFN